MNFNEYCKKILTLNLAEEPILTLATIFVILVAILGFISFMFKTISGGKEFFSSRTNLIIFIIIASGLYYLVTLHQNRELEIIEFKTKEAVYGKNDAIRFNIETNKRAFFYIYTFNKKGNRKLIFSDKIIFPYKMYETPSFRVKPEETDFNKEEKVVLLVSVNPLTEAKKEMTQKRFSKMIELDDNLTPNSVIVQKKEEKVYLPLVIKFKKDVVKLKIEIDSSRYKKQEDIYIDTLSSTNGYVTIFEGTVQNLHRVKSGRVKSDERFKSQVEASSPLGKHIIIALYNSKYKKLTRDDFEVVVEEKKGRDEYALKFKNEAYPYTIKTYMVKR